MLYSNVFIELLQLKCTPNRRRNWRRIERKPILQNLRVALVVVSQQCFRDARGLLKPVLSETKVRISYAVKSRFQLHKRLC